MRYQDLHILLSCHGLEDFPVYQKAEQATSLLASWTALWHPALIQSAESLPSLVRVDAPPENVDGRLLVVPLSNEQDLQTGFARRVEEEGGRLIQGETDRSEIVAQALTGIEIAGEDGQAVSVEQLDSELIKDFYALGFCYLQIQILTRHMRYSSNLDQVYFDKQLVDASRATINGNSAQARELLTRCFDVLAEERNHFYPVDAFLIDVTLIAETTLGETLSRQLAEEHHQNLLVTGEDIEKIADQNPTALDVLKRRVSEGSCDVLGGTQSESPLTLLSQEAVLRQFKQGLSTYQQKLDSQPRVFARRRFGMSPFLPQVLKQFGFLGAFHVSLDEGRMPESIQTRTRWEGAGEASIESLTRPPLKNNITESFLNLGVKLGEAMDMDHLAVVWFAHWPGETCEAFEDLVRASRYCGALGRFVTASEFLGETDSSLHSDRFAVSEYRSPLLKQAVAAGDKNPLSRSVHYWDCESRIAAINSLEFMTAMMGGSSDSDSRQQLARLASQVDEAFETSGGDSRAGVTTDAELNDRLQQASSSLASAVPQTGNSDSVQGLLVVNPLSFVRRMSVDVSQLSSPPDVRKPVYACDSCNGKTIAIVDVPPMGFAWLGPGSGSAGSSRDPLLAEGTTLRNEFLQAEIDPNTGGIISLHDYQTRGNRMSHKLGLRLPPQQEGDQAVDPEDYGNMLADKVEVTASSRTFGEIVATGKLVDSQQNELTRFRITYRIDRGSRVLEVAAEISCDDESIFDSLGPNPWESYLAARFAWNSEGSDLNRCVQQTRQPIGPQRIESSHFLEVSLGKVRTTIFSRGAGCFRQRGLRNADLPLVVRGESSRRFQYAIGVDVPHPVQQSMALAAPGIAVPSLKPEPDHCWLFHLDSRNVIATWWEPIVKDTVVVGFSVRLLETMQRSTTVHLSAMLPIVSARRVDLRGKHRGDCGTKEGVVEFDLARGQLVTLECFTVNVDGGANAGKETPSDTSVSKASTSNEAAANETT